MKDTVKSNVWVLARGPHRLAVFAGYSTLEVF